MSKRPFGEGSVRTRTTTRRDGTSSKRYYARIGIKNPLTEKTQYRSGSLRASKMGAEEDHRQLAEKQKPTSGSRSSAENFWK